MTGKGRAHGSARFHCRRAALGSLSSVALALAHGDGYVEVVADATNAYRMFGLSNGDSNAAYWDIDFALYPADGGYLYVYEGGTYRGYFGTYAVGDRLRVAVEAGVVRCYKNNALLYISGTAPTYPLLVDTSLYTPNGQVAQAMVSSGFREWTKYYYAGSQRVALRSPSGLYYLHGDHLGSTTLSTTSGGALQSAQRYSAYGNLRTSSGAVPSDYRFTGQRREGGALGINVYDYGARFYSAFIGRFLSADSIVPGAGNPQALNRYAYTFNNPLRYVDPSGHCPIGMCIADFLYGVAAQWRLNQGFLTPDQEESMSVKADDSDAKMIGRHVGNIASMATGIVEGAVGAGAMVEGGAICAGSAGLVCVVGGAEALAGGAVALHGASATLTGAATEGQMLRDAADNILMARGKSGSPRMRNVSGGEITSKQALEAGEKWLGKDYQEIAPGVYRSKDGTRQFRIRTSDLTDPKGVHVHFESIDSDGRTILENDHVYITDP